MSLKWIRETYGVPAYRGRRVTYQKDENHSPKHGRITSSYEHYVRIWFDGDVKTHPAFFHPTWQLTYHNTYQMKPKEVQAKWGLFYPTKGHLIRVDGKVQESKFCLTGEEYSQRENIQPVHISSVEGEKFMGGALFTNHRDAFFRRGTDRKLIMNFGEGDVEILYLHELQLFISVMASPSERYDSSPF